MATLMGSIVERAAHLAALCGKAIPNGQGWMACCPAHDDRTPSLAIGPNPAHDKVLIYCHAKCPYSEIVTMLYRKFGILQGELFLTGLAHDSVTNPLEGYEITATYDYVDQHGTLLHQTLRYEHPYGGKTFRQRRPDPLGKDGWTYSLAKIETVLYHLPEVLSAIVEKRLVYLVEGEKDADTLRAFGLVATCNAMGAVKSSKDKTWRKSYTTTLANAHVVLLADCDEPGRQHVATVATHLAGVASTLKVIDAFHTDTKGSDVTDWFAAGNTFEDFAAIVNAAPLYAPQEPAEPDSLLAPLGWSRNGSHGTHAPTAATSTTQSTPASPVPQWQAELIEPFTNKKGIVHANNGTICAFLRNHTRWQRRLWWDEMAAQPMLDDQPLSDETVTNVGAEFARYHRLPVHNDSLMRRCLTACCHDTKRDLLQEYLDNEVPGWDGVKRLETWLLECAGLPDTAYHRFLSLILPVSMVARGYEPGCLYRNVLVFEGPEEFRKSTFVEHLVPFKRWHTSFTASFDSKDAPLLIQGVWVAELTELDTLSRTQETRLKSFISDVEDAYIPKWQIYRVTPKRRAIFVGTTNESNWLKEPTGNTRFWPLHILHPMDVEELVRIREQLLAEAKLWYHDHTSNWWATPADVQKQASEVREERRQASPYEAELYTWLETERFSLENMAPGYVPVKNEVRLEDIARHFFRIERKDWKDPQLMRLLIQALKALGWKTAVRKRNGGNIRLWVKEPPLPF